MYQNELKLDEIILVVVSNDLYSHMEGENPENPLNIAITFLHSL